MVDGIPHAVMLKADFETAKSSLAKSMEITSPFGTHGLTIYAHPLTPDDHPASPGTGAVAHLTITRTRFGETSEEEAPSKVLMSHITSVANGEPIKAQKPLLAGFNRKFKRLTAVVNGFSFFGVTLFLTTRGDVFRSREFQAQCRGRRSRGDHCPVWRGRRKCPRAIRIRKCGRLYSYHRCISHL